MVPRASARWYEKKLQRYETAQGAERLGHLGNPQHARGAGTGSGRFVADDHVSGPDLLDELGHLEGTSPGGARWGYEEEQVVRLDALEGAVQHRLGRHALGLQVGGLFDLERRLRGRHPARPATEKPDPTPPRVLARQRLHLLLGTEGGPQRVGNLLPHDLVRQGRGAGPVMAEPPRQQRQHGHGARVADRVGGRLLLRHRPEHGVGQALTTPFLAGYEGRRTARLPGLLQREGRVALGAAVADGDEAIIGPKFRPVEREVEGVDGTDVGPAAVGPHQVLPHQGRVVRGADAGQEDPLAGSYS